MTTLCPKCSAPLTAVNIEAVTGNAPSRKQWKCIAYTCPFCSHALSVQIDPIALKTDILGGVQALLAKHQP